MRNAFNGVRKAFDTYVNYVAVQMHEKKHTHTHTHTSSPTVNTRATRNGLQRDTSHALAQDGSLLQIPGLWKSAT